MTESKIYTVEEVKKHNTENDCWIIIHGKVYDVTKFLPKHPGGVASILDEAGSDATELFDDVPHSVGARRFLRQFCVGDIAESGKERLLNYSSSNHRNVMFNSSYKWMNFALPSAVLLGIVFGLFRRLRRR